jgi:hypothetical protein
MNEAIDEFQAHIGRLLLRNIDLMTPSEVVELIAQLAKVVITLAGSQRQTESRLRAEIAGLREQVESLQLGPK